MNNATEGKMKNELIFETIDNMKKEVIEKSYQLAKENMPQ